MFLLVKPSSPCWQASVHKSRFLSLRCILFILALLQISGVLDFDQVLGDNLETLVAYGVCEELDELKLLHEGLPDFLDTVGCPLCLLTHIA
eukprot:jgi/Mesen1/8400/ME000468S07832